MPHFVHGIYGTVVLWATLHNGRVTWTDHKPDAHGFTAEAAQTVRARAPAWLGYVRVGTLMNYRGVSWDRPERRVS
jgi:hypothetical protein